jgi:hypothetical protein
MYQQHGVGKTHPPSWRVDLVDAGLLSEELSNYGRAEKEEEKKTGDCQSTFHMVPAMEVFSSMASAGHGKSVAAGAIGAAISGRKLCEKCQRHRKNLDPGGAGRLTSTQVRR